MNDYYTSSKLFYSSSMEYLMAKVINIFYIEDMSQAWFNRYFSKIFISI